MCCVSAEGGISSGVFLRRSPVYLGLLSHRCFTTCTFARHSLWFCRMPHVFQVACAFFVAGCSSCRPAAHFLWRSPVCLAPFHCTAALPLCCAATLQRCRPSHRRLFGTFKSSLALCYALPQRCAAVLLLERVATAMRCRSAALLCCHLQLCRPAVLLHAL